MNSIKEIIEQRRTTHSYEPFDFSEEALLECLKASLLAPNHKLTQPTRYRLAGPKTREKVFDFLLQQKAKKEEITDEIVKSFENKFKNPTHLVIVTQKLHTNKDVQKEDYATLSCCLHNLALLLWEKDIGTKWSTGGKIKLPELYEIADVDAKEESIEGLFWIGKPKKINPPPPRDSLEKFLKRLD